MNNHKKSWFINRIGKEVCPYPPSLFNTPIKIHTKSQAISLYLTQVEKGIKYTEWR